MIPITQIFLNKEKNTIPKQIKKQKNYVELLYDIIEIFLLKNKNISINDINLIMIDNNDKKYMITSEEDLNDYYDKIKEFEFYIIEKGLKESKIINDIDKIINNYNINLSNNNLDFSDIINKFKQNFDKNLSRITDSSNIINQKEKQKDYKINIVLNNLEKRTDIISCNFMTFNNIKIKNIGNETYKKLLFVKDEQNSSKNINFISNAYEGTNFQNLTLESEFTPNEESDKFSMTLKIKNPEFEKSYQMIIYIRETLNGKNLSNELKIKVKIKKMEKQEKQVKIKVDDIFDELYKNYINIALKKEEIFDIKKKIKEEKLDKDKVIKWILSQPEKFNINSIIFLGEKKKIFKLTQKEARFISLSSNKIKNIGKKSYNYLKLIIDEEKTSKDFIFYEQEQYNSKKLTEQILTLKEGKFKPGDELELNTTLSIKNPKNGQNYKMFIYIRDGKDKEEKNLSNPFEINVNIIENNSKSNINHISENEQKNFINLSNVLNNEINDINLSSINDINSSTDILKSNIIGPAPIPEPIKNQGEDIIFIKDKRELEYDKNNAGYIQIDKIGIKNISNKSFKSLSFFLDKEKSFKDFHFFGNLKDEFQCQDLSIFGAILPPGEIQEFDSVLSIKNPEPGKCYKMYIYVVDDKKNKLSKNFEIIVKIKKPKDEEDPKKIMEKKINQIYEELINEINNIENIVNINNLKDKIKEKNCDKNAVKSWILEKIKKTKAENIYNELIKSIETEITKNEIIEKIINENKNLEEIKEWVKEQNKIKEQEKAELIYEEISKEINLDDKDKNEVLNKIIELKFDKEQIKEFYNNNDDELAEKMFEELDEEFVISNFIDKEEAIEKIKEYNYDRDKIVKWIEFKLNNI